MTRDRILDPLSFYPSCIRSPPQSLKFSLSSTKFPIVSTITILLTSVGLLPPPFTLLVGSVSTVVFLQHTFPSLDDEAQDSNLWDHSVILSHVRSPRTSGTLSRLLFRRSLLRRPPSHTLSSYLDLSRSSSLLFYPFMVQCLRFSPSPQSCRRKLSLSRFQSLGLLPPEPIFQ